MVVVDCPGSGFHEELLDEIEEIINVEKDSFSKKKVPIIFDGKQYAIKIPKKIAESAGISENDQFEFYIKQDVKEKINTELRGKLVKDET
ncbi:MAG: hypothetical protein ACLFUO_05645 [Candidatus Woesearchaeota archaeon]